MSIKTYGWQSQEQLKFINENPQVLSLLYDLGILPEEISARVRAYVEEERERCAKLLENGSFLHDQAPAALFAKEAAAAIRRGT